MVTVNAMGDICPIPVVKTKKAIDALTGPDQIEVLVDNETAMRNVMKLAKSSGASAEQEQLEGVPGSDHCGGKCGEEQCSGGCRRHGKRAELSCLYRDSGCHRL